MKRLLPSPHLHRVAFIFGFSTVTNLASWPFTKGNTPAMFGETGGLLLSQDVPLCPSPLFLVALVLEGRSRKRLHLSLYLWPLQGSGGLARPLSLVLGHLATDSASDFLLLLFFAQRRIQEKKRKEKGKGKLYWDNFGERDREEETR